MLAHASRRTSVVRFQFQRICVCSPAKRPTEFVLRIHQEVVFESADENSVGFGFGEEAAAFGADAIAERALYEMPPR